MAISFSLGGFDLDLSGNALQNGVKVGAWTTTSDNKIQVTTDAAQPQLLDVVWKFNSDNQLTLSDGSQEIFNFQNDQRLRPRYKTKNAVLVVDPSKSSLFSFELRGEWDLTPDHDLAFTINGERSVIDGFISDPRGRFIFFFSDKTRPLLTFSLGFVGSWVASPQGEGVLDFKYLREDGTEDVFTLPGSITINRSTNQLRYEYQKDGTQSIDFVGTLIINPDFEIKFVFNRQLSGSGETQVAETTVGFAATFTKTNFEGNLELTLQKSDGTPGSTTLTIAGSFTAVRGATQLQVGFTFQQVRAGQSVTTTFGFEGELAFSNGSVRWSFLTSNAATRTITLAFDAQIKLGKAHIDTSLNLDVNGESKGITFLLGVSF